MLVLTRTINEALSIGHDVSVLVARIASESVDLAITAPANLPRRILPKETSIPADQEVISLCVNESLQIGETIRITVVVIHSDWVRLGIECPRDIMPRRID
jgi:carbon storage regulator CsrA